MTIGSLLFFFMNYQQYRTISSSSSLPAFQLLYALPDHPTHPHPPRNTGDTHPNSSRFFQKQLHSSKQPLPEFKADFQYSKINSQPSGPLSFSQATPQKLKAKKTGRPMAKISHKSHIATSPKQPEGDFFKEETSQMTRVEFSKTTGVLYPFQTLTESSPLKQHTDTASNQSLRGLVSRQSKSKILDPPAFEGSSSYNSMLGTRNQQFLLETINSQKMEIKSFQGEIVHVNMELRALREKEERNELRASRKKEESERMQLQLKAEQNSKLLVEIESMEKDLRGRQELNRYLEHQCSAYLAENTALKEAAENSRGELAKKEEVISVLHREIDELEQGIGNHRQKTAEFESEKLRLNRALESQRESIQQMQMSSDVDKSEIHMLRTKIETLQKKYEQLMGSIVEVQSSSALKEEAYLQEQKILRNILQQQQLKKGVLEKNLQKRETENQQLLKHCEEIKWKVEQFTKAKSEKEREHQQLLNQHQYQKQSLTQMTESLQKYLAESQREAQAREQTNSSLIEKLQHQILAGKQKQSQYQSAFMKLEQQKVKLDEQLHKAEDAIKEREHRILLLESSLQRCQQKLHMQNSHLGICQGQLKRVQEYSASLQTRVEKQMAEYELHLRDLRLALASSEKEKSNWQEECSALSERLSTLGSSYESLRQSNSELQALHSEVLSRSCSYVNSNHQLEGMYSALQEQYLHVSTRLKEIQEERDSLKIQNELLGTRFSEKERELMSLRQLYSKGVEELSTLEDKGAALREESRRVGAEKEELEGLTTELRRQISSLLLIIQENEKRYQSDTTHWEQLISSKEREMSSSAALFEETQRNLQAAITQLSRDHQAESHRQLAELHSREELITKMKETNAELTARIQEQAGKRNDSPAREALSSKGWTSSQSLESFCSEEGEEVPQIVSMGDLGEGEVNYIEMDREGIDYLCELLAIETTQGNLLTQIVGEVENILERYQKEEGEMSQYRQLLSQFGVEAKPFGLKTLLNEVQAVKEHLCLLVSRLAEEEKRSDLIFRENEELVGLQEIERECRRAYEKEEAALICELNDEITRLNACLANHRIQVKQALSLAAQGCAQRMRSEAFVTARSFELVSEQ